MAKKKVKLWKKDGSSLFEKFAMELCEYTKTGESPAHGDLDLQYSLELQHKRLEEKNLSMSYELIPRGQFPYKCPNGRSWSDEHYRSDMEWRTCRLERKIYRDDDCVFRNKKPMILYQNITNALGMDKVADDVHTCPACGAISTLGTLEKGCPYCGSFFKMSDLFPKTTNYYFIEDSGRTGDEMKWDILSVVIPTAVVFIIYLIIKYLSETPNGNVLWTLIVSIIGGAIGGGIIGYMLWAILKLFKLFWEAGRSLPLLFNMGGSRFKFERLMKKHSPEFAWEYFSDKVISLLKMILYAENPTELPSYVGDSLNGLFDDIVDSHYTGAVGLRKFKIEGDWCYVTADTYMDNVYDVNGRIRQKRDRIRVYLCRNLTSAMNINFSIKHIQCKNCGSSFDATKQRNCPACETRYEIEGDDWVVLRIERV